MAETMNSPVGVLDEDTELRLEEVEVSEEEIGQLYMRERQDVTH